MPCAAAAAGPHRSGAAAPPAPLGSQLACVSAAPPIAPRRGHVEARITSALLSVASECRKGRPREHGGAPGSRIHADPSPQPEHSDFGLAEIRPTDILYQSTRLTNQVLVAQSWAEMNARRIKARMLVLMSCVPSEVTDAAARGRRCGSKAQKVIWGI